MRSFCIIGLGCFGMAITRSLLEKKSQVLVIDEDADAVNSIADSVTGAVIGDPTNEAVLRAAGVTDYDCAVVCIDDNMNNSVLCTMILKELGVKEVVSRAMNDRHKRVLERVGADIVVFPEQDMGDRMAQILVKKDILDYFSFSEDCSIAEIHIPKEWAGKSIIECNIRRHYGVNVIAVRPAGGKLNFAPKPDEPLREEDTVTVIGTDDQIDRLARRLR